MRARKAATGAVLAAVILFVLLSIPAPDPPLPPGAAGKPFTWKQDAQWEALEASFLQAREIGCRGLQARTAQGFRQGRQYLTALSAAPVKPSAVVLQRLESLTFGLGTRVAACPERIPDYIDLVTNTRRVLKRQSQRWDLDDRTVRDRLYRMLYGGRAALEEVMLQAPAGSYPGLIRAEDADSVTPAFAFQGLTLRSGDILVSRGGAPTSALIARGNDYPGNFSHVALLHVDEKTGVPGIVESHIEVGVVVSSVQDYIRDKKLRVMVLRPRPDLPQVKADPMLPHRAAKRAHDEARSRHIPYDFAMDFRDPSKWFCSEVASWAYGQHGVELWKGTTRMSAPGVVRWLSYFGVTHFETQAPADLEYDPQLTVVAEWRDPETLWQDHVDNAVVEAMLEGADQGDTIPAPWWKIAAVRLAKAYSVLLNLFGRAGPVPEGMDATAALRNLELSSLHERMKTAVLAKAAAFERDRGYRPPYWELVRVANEVRKEAKRG
ncbi:MAG TPA: YiiX/YebB-like N1pC/P60 family cysteine hydrolase [Syntrophales bacterium]|nr:YiiX/YebB-like N1pC/P60 family cysteine hydrolase [Syntrophales bacterium]HNS53284.1 YiiX/YebB-like N1pC/P60 family cysteine hydrolase [Syntrophales bacterium]HQL89094.1 YiiX/YebB-like N1pC/P60 family cysteine hydrolase [Syntrophales bacterium]